MEWNHDNMYSNFFEFDLNQPLHSSYGEDNLNEPDSIVGNFNLNEPVNSEYAFSTARSYHENIDCSNAQSCDENVDYSSYFIAEQVFDTREAFIFWARAIAQKNGFVLVIRRSDKHLFGRKGNVTLMCERGGKYQQPKNPKDIAEELKRKGTGTKKCDCPFKIQGLYETKQGGWVVKIKCGFHNHPQADSLHGHSLVGRLSAEEYNLLANMTQSGALPKNILVALKKQNSENVTCLRQIYNDIQKNRCNNREGRTEMQQLLRLISENNYVECHRVDAETQVIKELFWAHSESIHLLNTFPYVLIFDTTYKTNEYGFPLLEIVGITSTEFTFSVAHALIEAERVDNYIWALKMLKSLIRNTDTSTRVIITDNDKAVETAVKVVFPSAKPLLCRWHISRNVEAKIKINVKDVDLQCSMIRCWGIVMNSLNVDEYKKNWKCFLGICREYPYLIKYISKQWIPYKEQFVSAWTNKFLHFGNRTSNRAEGAHSTLKSMLKSRGDFVYCWATIDNLITLQHNEIRRSFEISKMKVEHQINKSPLFKKLIGYVSKNALHRINEELERVNEIGLVEELCGCVLSSAYGLPCAHQLAKYVYKGCTIPLSSVHTHWKRLTMKLCTEDRYESYSFIQDLEAVQRRFDMCDVSGKIDLHRKVRELAYPDTTTMRAPVERVKTKGRQHSKVAKSIKRERSYFEHVESGVYNAPRSSIHVSNPSYFNPKNFVPDGAPRHSIDVSDSSYFDKVDVVKDGASWLSFHVPDPSSDNLNIISDSAPVDTVLTDYINEFPKYVIPFIKNIIDVARDGNCGFRVVANWVTPECGEENYFWIRHELYEELMTWHKLYLEIFGEKNFKEYEKALNVQYWGSVPMSHWMTMPDMGFLIASKFNVVVVYISPRGCTTLFPLRSEPKAPEDHEIVGIGFVNNCHFVQVILHDGSPIPPTHPQWKEYRFPNAYAWEISYIQKMLHFKNLQAINANVGNYGQINLVSDS